MAPLGVRLGCREGLPARPGHVRGPWWVQVVVVVGVGGVWAGRQEAIDERDARRARGRARRSGYGAPEA